MNTDCLNSFPHAPFGKRLLAIFYDSLIVFFIILITIIVLQSIAIAVGVDTIAIPSGEEADAGKEIPADSFLNYFFKSLWLILSLFYFSYFWVKRGQTPGMKVWKIIAVNGSGKNISVYQSVKRYLFAFFGFGLLLIPFNKKRLALQDILSNTHLIIPDNGKPE